MDNHRLFQGASSYGSMKLRMLALVLFVCVALGYIWQPFIG